MPKTEEWKKKVSDGRKKFLKENPDKHPWKNRQVSKPCDKVKEILDKNKIKYVEEYQPLDDRFFSIDIAFPDIKFGLEINGNQHYDKDGNLTPYYQDRHNAIINAGWTLLEIHYTSCFDEDYILSLINVKEQPDYTEYFLRKTNKKRKIQDKQTHKDNKINELKDKVLNSNIDFSKFGWVKQVSSILDIPSQKVNLWMKKHLLDFYNDKCFKKRSICL